MPFVSLPEPCCRMNHRSAYENVALVSSEIEELVAVSCVVETDVFPLVCSPLLVAQNRRGNQRLVVDLRGVNQYLPKQKFKYEGLGLVPDLCGKGDFFFHF